MKDGMHISPLGNRSICLSLNMSKKFKEHIVLGHTFSQPATVMENHLRKKVIHERGQGKRQRGTSDRIQSLNIFLVAYSLLLF